MPLNIPDRHGIAVIHFQVTGDSQDLLITCGYEDVSGEPDGNSPSVNAAAWRALFTATGRPFAPANMPVGISVTKVTTTQYTDGAPFIGESVGTTAGAVVAQPLPLNVSYIVNKTTTLGGRQGRGRMLVPGPTIGATSVTGNGFWVPAARSAQQTIWNSMLPAMFLSDLRPRLFHPVLAPSEITAFDIGQKLGTIRRRLNN